MPVRLTGMVSGMDTDTLIQQLVSAKRSKIDDIRGKKTKIEWQKEAWSDTSAGEGARKTRRRSRRSNPAHRTGRRKSRRRL